MYFYSRERYPHSQSCKYWFCVIYIMFFLFFINHVALCLTASSVPKSHLMSRAKPPRGIRFPGKQSQLTTVTFYISTRMEIIDLQRFVPSFILSFAIWWPHELFTFRWVFWSFCSVTRSWGTFARKPDRIIQGLHRTHPGQVSPLYTNQHPL